MFKSSDYHVQGPQIHQFNNVAEQKIPRSSFKRDFTRRTTFNTNYLIPIMLDEILPGDDINIKMTAMTRMATPIKPLMDNLYLETFWFFVPNRLVWSNWEKFQGFQANPADSIAYTIPRLNGTVAPISTTGFTVGSIYDYFGLPTQVTNLSNGTSLPISALFNRAYNLIWNNWFRDENLDNSVTVSTGDGPDDPATYTLLTRRKRKDYFTSCLPSPQKGTAVSVNLGTKAYIASDQTTSPGYVSIISTAQASAQKRLFTNDGVSNVFIDTAAGNTLSPLYADLTTATPITINALRQAALYQQILELDARGGTRYVEAIYSRFGVISPDFRLQRPELIGQGSSRINIYSVPQTSAQAATGTTTPQGNLAAFGTSIINGDHGCRYSATEHGMLIGLCNVRADLTYQQGLPKMFSRATRYDFYEPLLNGLGEQAVLKGELFAQGTAADLEAFGYQERFSEYRFKNSEITGIFRSTYATTLDVWHLSQEFASMPTLNSTFIAEDVPMDRILAVPTEPDFLSDMHFSYNHVRPMPIRSNPGIDVL